MTKKVVVVGGGHNGLVAASLLQRAGISCTILEKRASVGGACRAEVFDGQLVNWGANHLFMLSEDVLHRLQLSLDDLQLKAASQEAFFLNSPEISHLVEPHRMQHFKEEVEIASATFKKHLWSGKSSVQDLVADFKKLKLSSGLCFLEGSILDALLIYFHDAEEHLGALISGRVLSKYRLDEKGTAISILYLAMSNKRFGSWCSPRDGMQAVTDKMAEIFVADGGELSLNSEVVSATWIEDQVDSIQTAQGMQISADHFLFSGSPVEFERIFSRNKQAGQRLSRNQGWGTALQDGGCSKIMLSSSRPLNFIGAPDGVLKKTMIVRSLTVKEWTKAFSDAGEFGHSRQPYFEVFGSSEFHGSTEGPFTYSIFVMYSSYFCLSGLNRSRRELLKAELLSSVAGYIENPEVIRSSEVMDPVDLEEQFGLTQGNVDHGRFALDKILENRRFDLKLLGKTNVIGCGSGFFGGGLVTGVPGMLAADDILKTKDGTYGQ